MLRFCLPLLLILNFFLGVSVAQEDPPLRIWVDLASAPAFEALAREFEQETGYRVAIEVHPIGKMLDDYREALSTAYAPDLFIGVHDWIPQMLDNTAIAPLDLSSWEADFHQPALEALQVDGFYYGVPLLEENIAFLRHPQRVPVMPTDWEAVRQLSSEGQNFLFLNENALYFIPLLSAYGGYIYGRAADGSAIIEDIGLDQADAMAAANYFEGMVDDDLSPSGLQAEDLIERYIEGYASMMPVDRWMLTALDEAGVPYTLGAFPAGPGGAARPMIGVEAIFLNPLGDSPLIAESFLYNYVLEDTFLKTLSAENVEKNGRVPAYIPAREAVTDPLTLGFMAAGEEGQALPVFAEMQPAWTQLALALKRIDKDIYSGEDAFKIAAAEIRQALAEIDEEP
ncbi:hypothetical protein MASR2M15_26310 [Anaerolineales bacterium]